jgi:hypothetical protein
VRPGVDNREEKSPAVGCQTWLGSKGKMPHQYVSASERNKSADVVRLFKSYSEAELHGYYSLKRLKGMGLFVPDPVRPHYRVVVETKYGRFPVYSKEQCGGQTPQKTQGATDQETVSLSNTTTPHLSPTPFDVQNIASDVDTNDLRRKRLLERSKGSGASCTAYFPEGFEAHDWAAIEGMEEQAAIVFDQLVKFRHVHGQGADEFVSLSWTYGRELVGQRGFDRLMGRLLKANVLERTETKEDNHGLGIWVPRGKGTGLAYGYRFANPDYRRNYSKVIITGKAIQKRLKNLRDGIKYPVQKHLRRMLEELGAIMPEDAELLRIAQGDKAKADAVRDQILAIQRGERFFSVDRKTRRIFSNLTSLKRGARKHLRARGEAIWQVDLPCCHLLALPDFPARLAQYRERKQLKDRTLERRIEEVVSRMFAVEPSPADLDALCDELFHGQAD